MKTETFDSPDAFMSALQGKKRAPRGRATRPDIPSAPRSPSTGLSSLILRAWSTEFDAAKGYRLYKVNSPLDTGYWPSEAQACAAAKELERV